MSGGAATGQRGIDRLSALVGQTPELKGIIWNFHLAGCFAGLMQVANPILRAGGVQGIKDFAKNLPGDTSLFVRVEYALQDLLTCSLTCKSALAILKENLEEAKKRRKAWYKEEDQEWIRPIMETLLRFSEANVMRGTIMHQERQYRLTFGNMATYSPFAILVRTTLPECCVCGGYVWNGNEHDRTEFFVGRGGCCGRCKRSRLLDREDPRIKDLVEALEEREGLGLQDIRTPGGYRVRAFYTGLDLGDRTTVDPLSLRYVAGDELVKGVVERRMQPDAAIFGMQVTLS